MKKRIKTIFVKLLKVVERIVTRGRSSRSLQPLIFILGLPRTGTTVVYQYIVHRLHVSYFTNGVGNYPEIPCLVTWLQHFIHGDYISDFKSSYGKVKGPVAPREAGSFWARFFGYHEYLVYNDIPKKDAELLRNIIFNIQGIYGGVPFVNKNVKHMLRLDALEKIFPEAIFLVVDRDLEDVALSLYRARKKLLEHPEDWWSVRPPNFEELKDLPAYQQVAMQARSLKEKLETDLSHINRDRIITVNYNRFCEEPEQLILRIKQKITSLKEKNRPVDHFDVSINRPRTDEEELVIKYLEDG